jgi:hypothetical protein
VISALPTVLIFAVGKFFSDLCWHFSSLLLLGDNLMFEGEWCDSDVSGIFGVWGLNVCGDGYFWFVGESVGKCVVWKVVTWKFNGFFVSGNIQCENPFKWSNPGKFSRKIIANKILNFTGFSFTKIRNHTNFCTNKFQGFTKFEQYKFAKTKNPNTYKFQDFTKFLHIKFGSAQNFSHEKTLICKIRFAKFKSKKVIFFKALKISSLIFNLTYR